MYGRIAYALSKIIYALPTTLMTYGRIAYALPTIIYALPKMLMTYGHTGLRDAETQPSLRVEASGLRFGAVVCYRKRFCSSSSENTVMRVLPSGVIMLLVSREKRAATMRSISSTVSDCP